jgi:nicotinate-nucleotide pyrophosphorylase (carboxylating)
MDVAPSIALPDADDVLEAALAEDLGVPVSEWPDGDPSLLERDVTSAATIDGHASFAGRIVAREHGVVCGLPMLGRTLSLLAEAAGIDTPSCMPSVEEGAFVEPREVVARIEGPARVLLAAERTALNMLMTLSGIASEARRWQEAAGDSLLVVDTRKTWPGLRALSKYAVRVGGGTNHRQGLWDMALVKDNHLAAAGDVARAVESIRSRRPGLLVQVEADGIEQADRAARAGADIVLLDNMDDETLSEAVRVVKEAAHDLGRDCLTEASGGITFDRLPGLRATLVDRVSTSAITFARPVDFGLDAGRGRG